MTTVGPIVALVMVAAISLLMPAVVVRIKRKWGRSTTIVSAASVATTDNADESPVEIQRWPPIFVAATLPFVLMLLFLYAAAVQQTDTRNLWFVPVIILPTAVAARYAQRRIRHDMIGRDRD